jgi:drug/metabolite transporter (DMT)-like permease
MERLDGLGLGEIAALEHLCDRVVSGGVIILDEPFTTGMAIGLPLVLIGSYFASRKPAEAK